MARLAIFLFAFFTIPAAACGVATDCQLGDRTYRIYLPKQDRGERVGAIIFAHGWRGNAGQVMANKSMLKLAEELSVALVAPQSKGEDWQLPGRPRHTDNTGEEEFTYFRQLVNDITKRFPIDRNHLLMSGFSAGGMMTWNLACHEGKLFAGFAPIAGTFWEPVPERCPSPPVDLIHFHGTSDKMVPIKGRVIADTKQGEVPVALALFSGHGQFGEPKPVPAKGLDCKRRNSPDRKILEFCRHPGGHIYKADYVRRAWKSLMRNRSG